MCGGGIGEEKKNLIVNTSLPFVISLSMATITGSLGRCRFSVQKKKVALLRRIVLRTLFNIY